MNEEKTVTENSEVNKPETLRKKILEWLGIAAVAAAMLFFFAPESWWQFGVTPTASRKSSADFSLPKLVGGEWTFADQRGRVVIVNYWATWCPPCRVETPGLVNVANEYKAHGVETVGVSMDEDTSLIQPFVEKYQIPYPILLPGNDPNLSADGMTLPTTFLYDKNGKLAKKYTGIVLESTLKSDVEALLAEGK